MPLTTRSGNGFRMFRMATLTVLAGVAVSPIAFKPFGSVRSSRKIASRFVEMECPAPLEFSAGATIDTSPIACRICASAAMPGARTPSSLLTRIRYAGGCRVCWADAGTSRPMATRNARTMRVRCMEEELRPPSGGLRLTRRHLVEHEAVLHFFHREAFSLVDRRPVGIPAVFLVEAQPRPAPQLLGAHGRHIYEEKPTLDRRRLRALNRLFDLGLWLNLGCVVGGFHWGETVASARPKAKGPRPKGWSRHRLLVPRPALRP